MIISKGLSVFFRDGNLTYYGIVQHCHGDKAKVKITNVYSPCEERRKEGEAMIGKVYCIVQKSLFYIEL